MFSPGRVLFVVHIGVCPSLLGAVSPEKTPRRKPDTGELGTGRRESRADLLFATLTYDKL